MCGIAGFIDFSGLNQQHAKASLKRMTDMLVHRGPDEEGFHVDNYAALGHRRLSIIDLAGGHQPMGTKDGQLHIIFNGEIYNYPVLKKELESKGRRFRTQSDTETILHAYREWGKKCVEKLNGMFAFAIWDRSKHQLFLARDRVGKKPLYYYWDGTVFSFASELKAIRSANLCPTDIDLEALDCYFTFGYIPSPKTIYRNVYKLPAAHTLTVTSAGLAKQRYWELYFSEGNYKDVDTTLSQFEDLLDKAVQCRLMSEVPLGAFLSGGLDSTLVVSSMARSLQRPVLTNTIGFGDREHNELPVAKVVADYLRTDHREFVVQPDVVEILDRIAWHFDEPFADSSAVPTWYVCQMARKNVTVALSGDGGDENFGGYTFRYLPHLFESQMRSFLPIGVRRILFGTIASLYPGSARLPRPLRLKTIFENLARTDGEAFYHDLIWLRSDARKKIYSSDFFSSLCDFTPFEMIRPLYETSRAYDPLSRSLFADIHFYMTDNCLVKVDRMSMAHSLEVRSPLLDHHVIEFAARLPASLKVGRNKGKLLFREVAAKRLPSQVLSQPKRGFSIPAAQWLRAELKPVVEQSVLNKNSFFAPFLNRTELKKIWQEHQNGSRDHNVFLWGLMMLDLWSRKHLNQSSK